jgi:hypothetical protein
VPHSSCICLFFPLTGGPDVTVGKNYEAMRRLACSQVVTRNTGHNFDGNLSGCS